MRGGFLHNDVLVKAVEAELRSMGAVVSREHHVKAEGKSWFVDLFAVLGRLRITCEVELSSQRVPQDVAKAIALNADLLLIVAPEWKLARAVQERLARGEPRELKAICLPLGPALQRLRAMGQMMTSSNVRIDIKS